MNNTGIKYLLSSWPWSGGFAWALLNTSYIQLTRRREFFICWVDHFPVAILPPAEFCTLLTPAQSCNMPVQFGLCFWFVTRSYSKVSSVVRPEARMVCYPERLSIMNTPLFSERRTRGDLIITYRALSDLFNADLGKIFCQQRWTIQWPQIQVAEGQFQINSEGTLPIQQSVSFMEPITPHRCWCYFC